MFVEERQQEILKLLNEKNKVTVNELTEKFSVSKVTIRKDLNKLEEQNLLSRTHGGAIINDSVIDVPAIHKRKILNEKAKEKIGIKATEFVKDGETIMLDSGTTTFQVAKNLERFQNLIVISNSLEICSELIKYEGIKIIITGGHISKDNLSIRGSTAENVIEKYNANTLFLGVSALSLEKGFTTSDERAAEVKRQMIDSANRVIVVSDSSKFDQVSFSSVCEYNEIDALITDTGISDKYLQAFENEGIEVYTVHPA